MKRVMLVGIGESYYTGAFFQRACESLGISYEFVNEWDYLRGLANSKLHKLVYRLLKRPLTYAALNRAVIMRAREFRPESVLFNKGMFIAPRTLVQVKYDSGAWLVNYAADDPFNPVNSTRDLLSGISHYNLYACTKRAIMPDVLRAGCSHVEFVPFGYEPDVRGARTREEPTGIEISEIIKGQCFHVAVGPVAEG